MNKELLREVWKLTLTDKNCEICRQIRKLIRSQTQEKISFEEFWQIWPDRRAKPPAMTAWVKLSRDDQKRCLEVTQSWCSDWRRKHPEASHIMAASYLNQRRFEDEIRVTSSTSRIEDESNYEKLILNT